MAESLVLKGGRVLDATGERTADVVVVDGRIAAVGADLDADRTLDAGGCVVAPGLVDLHAHLRQPGREEAETVESGSRCAALGGFTAVVAMPNTTPAIDSAAVVREVQDLGRTALCAVHPSGAITVDRAGEVLAPMGEMADLGVRLFTDDGTGVQDDLLMRRAMEYAVGLPHDVVLAQHCENGRLAAGGHMHEGEWSSRLGIAGQPHAAEEAMVARDIALARLTGARIHMQHMSTAGSVAMIAEARASGLAVSAEATPHHMLLTHAECASFDPVFKVNPPLRTAADVDAVRAGVVAGTLDVIATDHAPHTQDTKDEPFDQAPPGMLGLEFALGVALAVLDLPLAEVLARMSWRPAAVVGLEDQGGPVEAGRPANLCVIDPAASWTVEPGATASRSRNIPYVGRTLTGRVRHTISAGEPVVVDGAAQR
ncbi:dihydroorotase [Iamia majanohamensis]|uniref:Dihydroorotase n=1 Tax=Iamia majanohamensis TaxID=467976 RepID=A0AAE9Y6J9_9ACTN|nr:dihydroorotase [Iamia majanohamensis]WCO65159.1 dihydroorotase [Iamia majanohamensis]